MIIVKKFVEPHYKTNQKKVKKGNDLSWKKNIFIIFKGCGFIRFIPEIWFYCLILG